jgi:hypothetical protein
MKLAGRNRLGRKLAHRAVGRSKSGRRPTTDSRYDSVETISRPEGRSDIRANVQRRCLWLLLADLDNPSGCGTISEP